MTRNDIREYTERFDISDAEADRIAETVETEEQFVNVWENDDWWTDENNQ